MICFKRFMQVHSWSDALCIRSRISNVLVMRSSGKMLKNNFACYNILIWLKNDFINFVGRKFRELIIIDLCNNWCGTIFECFINIVIILMQFYNQIVCITIEQDRKRIKITSFRKLSKLPKITCSSLIIKVSHYIDFKFCITWWKQIQEIFLWSF